MPKESIAWTNRGKVIHLCLDNIVHQDVDAIVNAANPHLAGGGGVDGAIHSAAGPKLMDACRAIKPDKFGVRCPVGQAVLTSGFNLLARNIIHTAGPVWQDGRQDEANLLKSCYKTSLELAEKYSFKRIAFPAISCGVYGFPLREAAKIAAETISQHLKIENISLNVISVVLLLKKEYKIFVEEFEKVVNDISCK